MDPAERFAVIVQARDDAIRLDEAAFCVAASARPDVDVDDWCGRVDELAGRAPAPTFEGVRRLLFEHEGFRGNADDYGDPANSFLDVVIERRLGIPITLSVLLIEVARRHGVHVVGVGMPGHFLTREAAVDDLWCDAFHGGAMLDHAQCAHIFTTLHGEARPLLSSDLAPTPNRAILSRMLANLEQGRFGSDPANLARCCELHLAIPDVPLAQRVQLLRAYARGSDPELVERAYAAVAEAAPDDVAESLRAEASRVRSRWN